MIFSWYAFKSISTRNLNKHEFTVKRKKIIFQLPFISAEILGHGSNKSLSLRFNPLLDVNPRKPFYYYYQFKLVWTEQLQINLCWFCWESGLSNYLKQLPLSILGYVSSSRLIRIHIFILKIEIFLSKNSFWLNTSVLYRDGY